MCKILLKQMREDCMKGTRIGAEKPKKGVLGGASHIWNFRDTAKLTVQTDLHQD